MLQHATDPHPPLDDTTCPAAELVRHSSEAVVQRATDQQSYFRYSLQEELVGVNLNLIFTAVNAYRVHIVTLLK